MTRRYAWLAATLLMAGMLPAQTGKAPAASPAKQPEMTVLKSTFVPGEKTIFYDDFTDMEPDSAPPHFKVRGAAVELREGGGLRQLTIVKDTTLTPNLTALPKNFTFEAEIKQDGALPRAGIFLSLFSKGREAFALVTSSDKNQVDQIASVKLPKFEELGRRRGALNWGEPVKLALWVQNGRLRTYLNGEKILDFNQVDLPEIDKVEIRHGGFYKPDQAVGYRMMRFAESAPDFSQMITSSGRYVTHGILFDTDSDRLKPESAPVIQLIATGLKNNPNLKLRIEGHTDSVGSADHNLDLSKRRAEAVKAVLVGQFQIEAVRLTTAGIGAAKPLDSNDTPQGRSQNRRVEFVRI